MKIEYIKGDFLDCPERIIVHGCNAQGVMGRGAALGIKTRFPYAFTAYRQWYEANGLTLGSIVWGFPDNDTDKIVGNMITQDQWHPSYGTNADYDAIKECFRTLNEQVKLYTHLSNTIPMRIGMVKIGAGLAGGDWSIIEPIIEEQSADFVPVVYVLE